MPSQAANPSPLVEEFDGQLKAAGFAHILRFAEAAQAIGVSARTLERLCANTEITFTRLHRERRFMRVHLAEFLASGVPG